jgi:ATP-dependent helicase/nuclease subunit A
MNLHKAKGLEAPVVILANPVGVPDHEPEKHIVRTGMPGEASPSAKKGSPAGPLGYFLFQKRSAWHGAPVSLPAGWDEKAAEEKKYEAAEDDRLMYVAATRARDLLVISAYEGDLGGRRAWGLLEDGMGDLPELERPSPGTAARPARGRLVLKPEEVRQGRLGIMAKRGTASIASYLLESVTSLAKRDRESPEWAAGGLGMRWGTAVHALLSGLGKARDSGGQNDGKAEPPEAALSLLARNALESAGIPPGEEEKLVGLVLEILASEFWARAMAAERRFFEVPFTVKTEPGDPEYAALVSGPGLLALAGRKPVASAKGAPLFLSGAIDLVFLESDGWVIADYKTDRLDDATLGGGAEGSKEAFAGLVGYYRPQVELYGRFWEKITGQRVKESGLYFTSYRKWVKIG